jgi:DNA-binding HxlR family transcriptional regulator
MSTAIKESSVNQLNKKEAISKCPVTRTLDKIGGRWKPIILHNLVNSTKRYNELRKEMPLISEKMLIQQLRELEKDNLIFRKVYPVVPPRVEYSLTEIGREMTPILNAMAVWGLKNG